jgi:hypothetical protein
VIVIGETASQVAITDAQILDAPGKIMTSYWPAAIIGLGVVVNLAWIALLATLLANVMTQVFL